MLKNTETLPIGLATNPSDPVGGTQSVQLTITVDAAPTENTTVQIDCGDHAVLVSPSGSWPYQAPIAAGHTTATITIGTVAVSVPSRIQIRGGGASENMANPANWTATVSLSVMSQPAPPFRP